MAGRPGRARIVVHSRGSAFGRALSDPAWRQSIGRGCPPPESGRRNWGLAASHDGRTKGHPHDTFYRSRLTDPAFAGSAALADYGAPELLIKRCPSQRRRRDVGLAESGFALPIKATARLQIECSIII